MCRTWSSYLATLLLKVLGKKIGTGLDSGFPVSTMSMVTE
jgi:hypothetical protein